MMNLVGLNAFTEACEYFHEFGKAIFVETHYCKNFISGALHPQLNYVYDLKMSNLNGLSQDIATLKKTGFPMIVLCDADNGERHKNFLSNQGLSFLGVAQTKKFSLKDFSYTKNISIKKVESNEMLEQWRDLAAIGFGYPRGYDEAIFASYLKYENILNKIKLFLAYMDNKPVGQSMLVCGKDISMNMWSSVIPEYRKRGILTAMIKHRLNEAKQLGYNTNIVQCMPMSAPVYDKLGFYNEDLLNLYTINSEFIKVENI